jgi:mRNA interferase HigB
MRVVARRTLRDFVESLAGDQGQAAAKNALDAWFHEVTKARWSSMADVKRQYRNASVVGSDRVVFNIKGNDFRLVVAVDFDKSAVWIKWLGHHRQYDRIDVRTIEHGHRS